MTQAYGAHDVSFVIAVALCAAAWLSGALFGWGLRETREWIARSPSPYSTRLAAAPAEPPYRKPRGKRRRSRGGGYYFSEEARGWGDQRWRRRLGWVSVGLIVTLIGTSLLVAVASYKPTRLPPAGAHHH